MATPSRLPVCDVLPGLVDPPELTVAASRSLKWFSAAAIVTWIACGLWPIVALSRGQFGGWPAAIFVVAFILYGAALLGILYLPHVPPLSRRIPLLLAVIETITALTINVDTNLYLNGTGMGLGLLVIVAAQLPYFIGSPTLWAWIVSQTVVLIWLIVGHFDIGFGGAAFDRILEGLMFGLAAVGFQVFAAASTILALSEGRARTNLARANSELTATRELLAESSRTSERLRISRDLHDTLGHHLTALSLQLDVAARLSDGPAAEHIQQAHAITKLLLSDVRDVVSMLRDTSRLNLAEAIRTLVLQPVGVRVHLEVPDNLLVDDARKAETILRSVQELLTNTARHAGAANLWIRLEPSSEGVSLSARDDGRGADAVVWGNGLRGMRERFEQHGGRVDVRPTIDAGFEVHAFMPLPSSA